MDVGESVRLLITLSAENRDSSAFPSRQACIEAIPHGDFLGNRLEGESSLFDTRLTVQSVKDHLLVAVAVYSMATLQDHGRAATLIHSLVAHGAVFHHVDSVVMQVL